VFDAADRSAVSEREQPERRGRVNTDGSVDAYFGLKAPAGFENNWEASCLVMALSDIRTVLEYVRY
jgi:hypothetical protein